MISFYETSLKIDHKLIFLAVTIGLYVLSIAALERSRIDYIKWYYSKAEQGVAKRK